ncbi:MAG: hypothetical protein U0325_00110 [Polyangiales bacterium]
MSAGGPRGVDGGLCLTCRTRLRAGEACDLDPRHPVAALDTPAGWEHALSAVWGPASARTQARQLARAGAGGGVAGGAAEALGHGCNGCGELAGAGEAGAVIGVLLAIVAVALSAVLLVWLIGKAVTAWQRRKHRLRPQGAPRALAVGQGAWVEGTVRATKLLGSFTGQRDCVAWGAVALADAHRGGPVLLRDGCTAAFTLALDDGRTVEVPAGRARGGTRVSARDGARGPRRRRRARPPRRAGGGRRRPQRPRAAGLLEVGAHPPGRPRAAPARSRRSRPRGYREAATVLRATGVPRLARVG